MATTNAMSLYLANKVLNSVLRGATFSPPTSAWVALFTGDPGEGDTAGIANAGSGEIVDNGYTRMYVGFGAATNSSAASSALITFPTATADWGTVNYMALFANNSAAGSTGMLYHGALDVSRQVLSGSVVKLAIGSIIVKQD